ncbi:SAM-dependent methyltransferase [soil metagenome]
MIAEAEGSADTALADRLRRRIGRDGPITFAAFMEAALYDPEEGFYVGNPVGERGHFVTSPHVSDAFGALLARQVEEFWELLGRPDPFDVVEVGAGDGSLASTLLGALSDDMRRATRYTAVERMAPGRHALTTLGLRTATVIEELPPGLTGCVLANELLDNLPFHIVRRTERGPVELLVTAKGSSFAFVAGPLSDERLGPATQRLPANAEGAVSLAAPDFLERAISLLQRGYIWLADYSSPTPGWAGPVHGYRRQRIEADVLAQPGSRDITAAVDFDALLRAADRPGVTAWGPVLQREALLSLGLREWDEAARQRQFEATANRRGVDSIRAYSERSRAAQLIDVSGLGGLRVMCVGVGVGVGVGVAPTSVRPTVPSPRVPGSTPGRPREGPEAR